MGKVYEVKPGNESVEMPNGLFYSLFLAGSIEMGKAEEWQAVIVQQLSEAIKDEDFDIIAYNPRRNDWDSSWEQSRDNPMFNGQVRWELNHIANADAILFYFSAPTLTPISLMELGYAGADSSKAIIVHCPEGFWRKGNVDVFCDLECIRQVDTFDEMVPALVDELTSLG